MQDNTDHIIQWMSSQPWKIILVGQLLQYLEGNPEYISITVYMKCARRVCLRLLYFTDVIVH